MASEPENRQLVWALLAVFIGLAGADFSMASGLATNGLLLILLLPPISLAIVRLYRFHASEIRGKWIELDCLPPYRTRSRFE